MAVKQELYLGNPNLKKANVSQKFTKRQIAEFLKCADNPVYFISKYIKIVSLDEGIIPFKMYDFQEYGRKFPCGKIQYSKVTSSVW